MGHFDNEVNFHKLFRYADTKLAVNAYVRQLAKLAPSEVIVNNLCPGMVHTGGLDRNLPTPLRLVMVAVRKIYGRSLVEGGRTLVYASVIAGPETNGKFMQQNKIDAYVKINTLHERGIHTKSANNHLMNRGAEFLNKPEGTKFIDILWKETVEDVVQVDSTLTWALSGTPP